MSDAPEVIAERRGGVTWLTLNRPDRLNAVSEGMYRRLIDELRGADADPDVRCVVLAGAGRAFCAGADLKAHASGERDDAARAEYAGLGQDACGLVQTMGTPVIAAVHGYALGAGAELAVAADFLVVAAQARLRFPEMALGTFVGGGVTARLPRLVGLRRASELLLLGDWFTGADAREWGLAYDAPTAGELTAAVETLAGRLAALAPLSVAAMKSRLVSGGLQAALEAERDTLVSLMRTRDWAEGVAAFAQRRDPVFHGR